MTSDDNLLRQAHMTAHDYMMYAKSDIDELFGNDFAAKHPELVAAYMQVAARDFDTAMRTKYGLGGELAGAITDAIERIRGEE
jgi:hypothetical protein